MRDDFFRDFKVTIKASHGYSKREAAPERSFRIGDHDPWWAIKVKIMKNVALNHSIIN